MLNLGERIRKIRESRGLSQSGLERKTQIKREYISKVENNQLPNPTLSTLRKLAAGFDVSVSDLLREDVNKMSENGLLRSENSRLRLQLIVRSEKTEVIIAQLKAVAATLEALNLGGK